MKTNTIYNEDCGQGMKRLLNNSIDLLATDPPYGIKFMGKSWDKALPSIDIWKEALRVLKPGAFAFVMCIPRQDCLARMIVSLEDAGFNVSFSSIFHCFAQGFPKAYNISQCAEKMFRFGKARRPDRDLGKLSRNRWSGSTEEKLFADTGGKLELTSSEAKALDGSYGGFQPKPAVEVVIVAMKSLSEKTYVDQALANGKGISWLDEGRIPYKKSPSEEQHHKIEPLGKYSTENSNVAFHKQTGWFQNNAGRFPANLLVSDDCLNDGKVRKSVGGSMIKRQKKGTKSWTLAEHRGEMASPSMGYGDSGSFSRYFSLDAWWEKRLKELPESVRRTFPFLIVPKAGKAEKNMGCEGLPLGDPPGSKRSKPAPGRKSPLGVERANYHPTVKPLKLMSYLITLGSRQGDIVLDPFIGSGTTAIAAVMMGRHYIGYETDKDYVRIANKRLSEIQLSLL